MRISPSCQTDRHKGCHADATCECPCHMWDERSGSESDLVAAAAVRLAEHYPTLSEMHRSYFSTGDYIKLARVALGFDQ